MKLPVLHLPLTFISPFSFLSLHFAQFFHFHPSTFPALAVLLSHFIVVFFLVFHVIHILEAM